MHRGSTRASSIEHIHCIPRKLQIMTVQRGMADVCWQPLPIVLGQFYVHVQRAHGSISKYGRQACQKMHYLWRSWPCQTIQSILRPFFLDCSNWWFSCRQGHVDNRHTCIYKRITIPLAHARGITWKKIAKESASLHEGIPFSIHSLYCSRSPCLLGCHDCIVACAGAQALNICMLYTCLRPHPILHLLCYCVFMWGTINICVWGWAIIRPREGHAGNNALIIA